MDWNKLNPDEDQRVDKILELIVRYTRKDYSARAEISGNGDVLDAIIAGLNTLGEELQDRHNPSL